MKLLEPHGYVQKVVGRSRVLTGASPSNNWKTLSVKPAVNGYLLLTTEG